MIRVAEARMAMTPCPTLATRYEAELATCVAACAEADAVRVGEFLRQFGIAPPPGQTLKVPAARHLDLGAARRMLALEEADRGSDPAWTARKCLRPIGRAR